MGRKLYFFSFDLDLMYKDFLLDPTVEVSSFRAAGCWLKNGGKFVEEKKSGGGKWRGRGKYSRGGGRGHGGRCGGGGSWGCGGGSCGGGGHWGSGGSRCGFQC